MKRFIKYIVLFALAGGSLQATDVLIEAKGAYFGPTDGDFNEIYSSGAMYGLEASFQSYRQLYVWLSGSLFTKTGASIGLEDPTRIVFYPIGVGLKYLFPYKKADLYLGAGGLIAHMRIHDHAPNIPTMTCRWGGGAIVKGGMLVNCTTHLFFDLFADYSFLYVPAHERSEFITHTANLSGWSVGLGIGYRTGPK